MSKEELDQVAAEVTTCTKCNLCKTRTKAVPGESNPSATIMLIGEGPGYHEDKQGLPFVGAAGQFLPRSVRAARRGRQHAAVGIDTAL